VIRFRLKPLNCESDGALFKEKTMAKKLTITLSDKAEKFFNQVYGTLDIPDGNDGFNAASRMPSTGALRR
jgi:hypothetical protein